MQLDVANWYLSYYLINLHSYLPIVANKLDGSISLFHIENKDKDAFLYVFFVFLIYTTDIMISSVILCLINNTTNMY